VPTASSMCGTKGWGQSISAADGHRIRNCPIHRNGPRRVVFRKCGGFVLIILALRLLIIWSPHITVIQPFTSIRRRRTLAVKFSFPNDLNLFLRVLRSVIWFLYNTPFPARARMQVQIYSKLRKPPLKVNHFFASLTIHFRNARRTMNNTTDANTGVGHAKLGSAPMGADLPRSADIHQELRAASRRAKRVSQKGFYAFQCPL
jgi:hypothetical protein